MTGAESNHGTPQTAEDEKKSYGMYINQILGDDEQLKNYLPINLEDDSLFDKLSDGVILCKLLQKIDGCDI